MNKSLFNCILDASPDEKFGGVIQKTDFKQVLKFFRVVASDLTDSEKTGIILKLFFDTVPLDCDIFEEIQDFIRGPNAEESEGSSERVFDYNVDHGRLLAAFLQTYGIDLRFTDLHWWVFLELFQSLPDETKLMQIIDLRGKKPDKNDSEEYKRKLRKLKNKFRIDDGGDSLGAVMDRW